VQDGGEHEVGCNSGQAAIQCIAAADSTHLNGFITVDDANIYWGEHGQTSADDFVMRASRTGGGAVTLARGTANALASDGTDLYWTDWDQAGGNTGTIRRIPVTGGALTTLATVSSPLCIALDDANVYWSEVWSGALVELPKAGGTAITLAHAMAGLSSSSIALDGHNVYWSAPAPVSVSKAGGAVSPVWDNVPAAYEPQSYCRSIAVVGSTLAFSFSLAGASSNVGRLPVTGGTSPDFIDPPGIPSSLGAGTTGVIWLDYGTAIQIDEASVVGGGISTLTAPPDPTIQDIVVASDGTIYWTGDFQVQSLKP
jgi:hypothetical protein